MKKNAIIPLVLLLLFGCNSKNVENNYEEEKAAVHRVLTEFFAHLSAHEWEAMKSLATGDMILVEHGLLWNNDSLINAMEMYWSDYDVSYSFDFIKTQIDGNTAWAVYHNHGVCESEKDIIHIDWIETVIFSKIDGEWKMVEAQSTRVKDPEIVVKQ